MCAFYNARNYLVELTLLRDKVPSFDEYPFSIPAIGGLSRLEFDQPVTFFVGENGSGKSTLLEAIAILSALNPEGGSRNFDFATRASHSDLKNYLRLARSPQGIRDAYFLRAESYFNVATEIERLGVGEHYGGKSLHEQSHGEAFFKLFTERMGGQGLYLLDEPEAALSPARQLALLSRIHDLIEARSQFIIATHSPILLAYPHATIYVLDDGPPRRVAYRETEHFKLTHSFLNRTDQMLAVLLDRSEPPDEEL